MLAGSGFLSRRDIDLSIHMRSVWSFKFQPFQCWGYIRLSTRKQRCLKCSKPCHVGFNWIALAEHS